MSYDASAEWIRKYATKTLLSTTENMPNVDNMFSDEDRQLLAEMNIQPSSINRSRLLAVCQRKNELMSYDASAEWIRKYATKTLLSTTENMPNVDNMFSDEDRQLLAEMNITWRAGR